MSTNHTPNYNLCQWEELDKVLRTEFNEDNAKIDAALSAHDVALEAEVSARTAENSAFNAVIAKLLNGRVYLTSYEGTGVSKYESNGIAKPENCPQIHLPAVPDLLIVIGSTYLMFHLPEAGNMAHILGTSYGFFGIKWEDSTAILEQARSNESSRMNASCKYEVIALYRAQ